MVVLISVANRHNYRKHQQAVLELVLTNKLIQFSPEHAWLKERAESLKGTFSNG